MKSFKVIIPARYASIRLPGKPLLEIAGKPLIQHAYESASASRAEQVIVATDDERIAERVRVFTDSVFMTSVKHQSGTDRLAEVVTQMEVPDETIIVNVQGDELGLPAILINQVAEALFANPEKQMATLCQKITDEADYKNPNVVKVVFDKDKTAIYFSRSPIPWLKEFSTLPVCYRHVGIYAYRTGFLKEYTVLPQCVLEQSEGLEQLRALYYGNKIHVEESTESAGLEINTEQDLEEARKVYAGAV